MQPFARLREIKSLRALRNPRKAVNITAAISSKVPGMRATPTIYMKNEAEHVEATQASLRSMRSQCHRRPPESHRFVMFDDKYPSTRPRIFEAASTQTILILRRSSSDEELVTTSNTYKSVDSSSTNGQAQGYPSSQEAAPPCGKSANRCVAVVGRLAAHHHYAWSARR